MRRIVSVALAAMAGLVFGGTAQAETVSAADPASLVKVLQDKGYRAELTKDDAGDPMIRSASSGTTFLILFYGCTDKKDCETVQFFAGYSDPGNASLDALNEWNARNRFGRAYLSDTGSARLEMDVDLDDGGMSAALFEDNLEFWVAIMGTFEKHIR